MPETSGTPTTAGADPWLRAIAPAARFILQGGAAAFAAAQEAFGVTLPAEPCRAGTSAGRAALWLGPDECLLLAPAVEAASVGAGLAAALSGIPHSLVEVSDRQVGIGIAGPQADDLLHAGCPLDLDPAAFPVDACTRTVFGKAEIVLWRKSAAEYHLEVWRSYSDYVLEWLREAGRSEFDQ